VSRDLTQKLAARFLMSSTPRGLSTVFQYAASSSLLGVETLSHVLTKALELINESEQKEHIYAEAGHLISQARNSLSTIEDGMSVVSYAALKLEEKRVKPSLSSEVKEIIDERIKKSSEVPLHVKVALAYITKDSSSQLPTDGPTKSVNNLGLDERSFDHPLLQSYADRGDQEAKDESIHDIENARDIPKVYSRPRDQINHLNKNVSYNVPKVPSHVRYR